MLLLYLIGRRVARHWRQYLHSTMLLLYPLFSKTLESLGFTFTFHYASTLSVLVAEKRNVYTLFTFHYASTLFLKGVVKSVGSAIFTFHYASTLSAFSVISPRNTALFTFHYASTLSSRLWRFWISVSEFTFHYASTLSTTIFTISPEIFEFTFHYASTLSQRARGWRKRKSRIYIPLCFYFIAGACRVYLLRSNLHSTMLLLYLDIHTA